MKGCARKTSRASIQPTYEELKHENGWHAGDGTNGIQPTYEELKQLSPAGALVGFTSIQPTYEELKPAGRSFLRQAANLYPAYL